MNVACPACGAKYRINEDRIKGSRARITCKKCGHKFIVTKGEDQAATPPPSSGVPVRIRRDAAPPSHAEEEDNEDVPTTVMPHGSKVIRKIREATAETPHPALGSSPPSDPPDVSTPPSAEPQPSRPPASSPPDLRAGVRAANAKAESKGASTLTTYLLAALFFVVVVVVMTLVLNGGLPVPN